MRAILIAVLLSTAAPAWAQDKTPEDRIREGAAAVVELLTRLIGQIPTYEAPEILPNGDIIIRRARPKEEPKPNAPTGKDGAVRL